MTKLQFLKKKQLRMLGWWAGACLIVLAAMMIMEKYVAVPFILWGTVIVFVALVIGWQLARLFSINDDYRIIRNEIVRRDGQMPFSKTYYIAQHRSPWWRNCKDANGRIVHSRNHKEIENYIKAKIGKWNETVN